MSPLRKESIQVKTYTTQLRKTVGTLSFNIISGSNQVFGYFTFFFACRWGHFAVSPESGFPFNNSMFL